MDMYIYLNNLIGQLVESGRKNIVLYPFGHYGMLVKQILNWRYGIQEALICDDQLSKINPDIKPLKYLSQVDTAKYCFVITSENAEYWNEIRTNLKKYVPEENIIDLFSARPLMSNMPRIASLELASREIFAKNIPGAAAEAGVYRGDFAVHINQFFHDRKLYLFDTFEGFADKDIDVEKEHGYSFKKAGFYSSTSEQMVLRKMPYRDNCIIKKGYFPDTAQDIDERFCFVSLDMDLYQPIKAGLEYFYPRLSRGGYIFIHDCTIGHVNYKGARLALLEFAEKERIGYVMLPDNKTAVITK